jgi:hypothetical protein
VKTRSVSEQAASLYNNLAKPLCTVLSVHFPTPPKPAGLDPQIFCMRKSLGIKGIFWGDFFGIFFRENAERSGATSECSVINFGNFLPHGNKLTFFHFQQ